MRSHFFARAALFFAAWLSAGGLQAETSLEAQAAQALAQFRAAEGLQARFDAARAVSAVRFTQGRVLAAQYWLRRAANYAPDRAAADRNRADFQLLRTEARLRPDIRVNISPSDNINNGVEERVFALGDILLVFPTSALALSGIEYTGQADLSWRLSEGPRQRTSLHGGLFARTYSLSSEAKRLAPNAWGRDYGLTQLSFGLSHARALRPGWGPSEVRLTFGKLWQGGAPLRRFQRLDLGQAVPLQGGHQAGLGLWVEHQDPDLAGQPNATLWGGRAAYQHVLPGRATLGLSLEGQIYDADIETFAFRSTQLRASVSPAKPVLTLALSLHATLARKSYEAFSLSLDGRRDRQVELGATAVFTELTAFGFSPSVTVSTQRTWSNVDRFDTRGSAVSFGVRSRF